MFNIIKLQQYLNTQFLDVLFLREMGVALGIGSMWQFKGIAYEERQIPILCDTKRIGKIVGVNGMLGLCARLTPKSRDHPVVHSWYTLRLVCDAEGLKVSVLPQPHVGGYRY